MVDINKIFTPNGTNIYELLVALVDPSNSIEDRRRLWDEWQYCHYSPDQLMEFFSDSLFEDGGFRFLDIVCNTDYRNFYEMAMSLDLANFDPKAYYLYWILGYGHGEKTQLVKDAFEYDPDTILSIFPNIQELLFDKEQ